jgi:hypothetical protein
MTQLDVELLLAADCPHEAAAIELIRHALDDIGLLGAPFRTRTVTSQQQANALGFTGSPTILINGIDSFAQQRQTPSLACRLYQTPDGPVGDPSLPELRHALQLAIDDTTD